MHNIGSAMTEAQEHESAEVCEEFAQELGEFGVGQEAAVGQEYGEQALNEELLAGEAPGYGEYEQEQALQEEMEVEEAVGPSPVREELLPQEEAALNGEFGLHEALGAYETEELLPHEQSELFESYEVSEELPEIGLSPQEVNQLAGEFAGIRSEQELNYFLGKIFRRIGRLIPRKLRRLAARGLRVVGGVVRRVTKIALPIAGKVAGGFLGGPLGSVIGSKVGNFASRLLEVAPQLNELPDPQRLHEIGRRFVRWVGNAAIRVGRQIPRIQRNVAAITRITMAAARRHAPEWIRAARRVVRGVAATASAVASAYRAPGYADRGPAYAAPVIAAPLSLSAVPPYGRWYRRGRALILMMR